VINNRRENMKTEQ